MPRLWLKLASAAVFLVAWTQSSALEPQRDAGTFQIDPPTPYIHYVPASPSRGRVLVVHGLHVSKEVMQIISAALVDGGFEVYNIDLPGHGDSTSGFDASLAQRAISGVMTRIGEDTIVLGHSLGAGLLLDLASDRHFPNMVLLSPPPLPLSQIQADRALVATGAQDIPRITKFAPIAMDIGSPRVEVWILPWAEHSAPIFSPVYIRRVVEWLGGDGGNTRTLARLVWIGVMFISAATCGVALMPGNNLEGPSIGIPATLVRYIAACGIALLVLKYLNPVSWLRLFAADYLVGFLFITGLILLLEHWRTTAGTDRRNLLESTPTGRSARATAIVKGVAGAGFVIFTLGWLAGDGILHTMPLDGRWWRFPCIAMASFPLFACDELTIRRILPVWKSTGVALITRVLFLAFLLIGMLILNREQASLFLIAPLLTLFWIALWFAAGVVHRHTHSAFAAALFAALVQGWAFASWFITI